MYLRLACVAVVCDLNWSIAIVYSVQSELGDHGSVYDLNWAIMVVFTI